LNLSLRIFALCVLLSLVVALVAPALMISSWTPAEPVVFHSGEAAEPMDEIQLVPATGVDRATALSSVFGTALWWQASTKAFLVVFPLLLLGAWFQCRFGIRAPFRESRKISE
jgi:hypothetical protein